MVGNVEITKKFELELTSEEMNTIVAALARLDTVELARFAKDKGVVVLPSYGINSELMAFYRNLKSLSDIK